MIIILGLNVIVYKNTWGQIMSRCNIDPNPTQP